MENSFKFIMHNGVLEAKQNMIKLIYNRFMKYREQGYEWNMAWYKTEIDNNITSNDSYTVLFWIENGLA